MTDANQLLRDYARTGSDSAFRELVTRYVDLVYSVAARRVGGDAHLAEDVAQQVFTDLAAKAATLPDGVRLGGWLHRHTCFVSSNMVRTERRRQAREREAVEMNLLQPSPEPTWKELSPLVDGAIDALDNADREAVILRYFEQQDFRAIGAALGISDDAAQKRVSRAVERLRESVAKQGVTLPAAVLTTLLTVNAVFAAPAGLAATVSGSVLAKVPSVAGAAGGLLALLSAAKIKFAVGAGLALVATGIVFTMVKRGARITPVEMTSVQPVSAEPVAGSEDSTNSPEPAAITSLTDPPPLPKAGSESGRLTLALIAADSGKPVPGVQVDYRRWEGGKFQGRTLNGNRLGVCEVTFPAETTTDLQLTTRVDGFADTRLHWRVDRGEQIPTNYVLRLARPVPIGGTVVDADGNPVADAKVGWNHEASPEEETRPESHEFSWIEMATDTEGRWRINRIAPEMIRRLYGSAKHSEHVDTGMMFTARDPEAEKLLRSEKHVFQLGRAIKIWGAVVDADDQPVAGAKVLLGQRGMSDRRETKSEANGLFYLSGCKLGPNLLSAEAEGFAATTLEVEVAEGGNYRLVLQRGNILRLRAVSQDGKPVNGANVWLNTFDRRMNRGKPSAAAPIQANFNPKTDQEGRVIWSNAPPGELSFDLAAKGYMRVNEFKAVANGEEQLVTMPPALVVHGTVRDAASGTLIPRFRMVAGWPTRSVSADSPGTFTTNVQWSTIDRHWLSFSGGEFRHSFEEPLIYGTDRNPGYGLKFTADGYAPFVSRVIEATEGEVRLDVTLQPAVSRRVTVLLPSGSPAVGVAVGLVSPGAGLSLLPGGLDRGRVQSGGALRTADAQGQFPLPPDESISRVIAAGPEGYGEATVAELTASSVLPMQPWGRIEGTYRSGGEPAVGRELLMGFVGDRDVTFDFQAFKVATDAEGRFAFPSVPWGRFKLVRLVRNDLDGRTSWTHRPVQDVEVRPGETTTVTIGDAGYRISARLAWTDGLTPEAGSKMFGMLHTPFPQPPAEIQNDPQAMQRWAMSPEIQELAKAARHYECAITADGRLGVDDVAPGQYELNVTVVIGSGSSDHPPSVAGVGQVKVVVPETPPTGTMDLGEILIRKPEPPK